MAELTVERHSEPFPTVDPIHYNEKDEYILHPERMIDHAFCLEDYVWFINPRQRRRRVARHMRPREEDENDEVGGWHQFT
jgi:hypothetical protein